MSRGFEPIFTIIGRDHLGDLVESIPELDRWFPVPVSGEPAFHLLAEILVLFLSRVCLLQVKVDLHLGVCGQSVGAGAKAER